ncbi:MAG: hypothetical protein WAX69_11000 [Victivallales bacterium]
MKRDGSETRNGRNCRPSMIERVKNINMSKAAILSGLRRSCALGAVGLALSTSLSAIAADPVSYIWLETPVATDFNTSVNWSTLTSGKAPANMPGGNSAPKENAFAEYAFELPAPGGKLTLWGRAFDQGWSSPARWRVDNEPWRDWQPGQFVNREIENKVFPIDWCRWGEIELTPGKHTLRLETLGKNKQNGNYPYFVLDVLLLARGEFTPRAADTPQDMVDKQVLLIKAKAQPFPNNAAFNTAAQTVAAEVLQRDLGAFSKFAGILRDIDKAQTVQEILKGSKDARLSGGISKAVLEDGKTVSINTQWSAPFGGKVWIGFTRDRALYAVAVQEVKEGSLHNFRLPLPANLPAGKILLQCVPVDQPLSASATGYVEVPPESAAAQPVAFAWGVYRDSGGRAHPWQVNANNLMYWDGIPFIPVGGMVNSLLSWTTKAGDGAPNAQWEDVLRQELMVLRSRGICDIYFNGCFVRSSPQSLGRMVAIAEECGMRYGLHPTSTPQRTDPGFVAGQGKIPVAAGEDNARIVVALKQEDYIPAARTVWCALNPAGEVVEHGMGAMIRLSGEESVQADKKWREADKARQGAAANIYCVLPVKLRQAAGAEGLQIKYLVERHLNRADTNGYLGTVDEYIAQYRETYGSLKLGAGMRMWIDPLENEMHYNPASINVTPAWRTRLAGWLLQRYGTLERLCEYWGSGADSALPDFATAACLVPLWGNPQHDYWMNPEDGKLYTFNHDRSQTLRDVREFSGILGEEMISRCSDALKRIADVPVVLKLNCWFSDWFVNPRQAGGLDGSGYEAYAYGDSLAYHNSLSAYAQVLQSGRHQWALVTESSPASTEGQANYCGYIDRLQMIYNIDQLMMFGAKGFYHYGFSFGGNPGMDLTDLLRDIRQVEWLATQSKAYNAVAEKLAAYHPEVYGWYPAHLRENQIMQQPPRQYEMDGMYTGVTTQIRQAPDGRWIVPALRPEAGWYGLLAAEPLLNYRQREELVKQADSLKFPVYVLQEAAQNRLGGNTAGLPILPEKWKRTPLDGLTSQGIGVIPPQDKAMTLDRFQREVLGYRVFQTADINGRTTEDGRLMVWTCVERKVAQLAAPESAKVTDINGKEIAATAKDGKRIIRLERPPYEKQTKDFPAYIFGGKYFYPDLGQPEVAYLSGVTVDELLKLNPPVLERWLPSGVTPAQVKLWQEAEDFSSTTFTQPRVEGFTRYSNSCGIGINSHYQAPAGRTYHVKYTVNTPAIKTPVFYLRRMEQMSKFFALEVTIDGQKLGEFDTMSDVMHLSVWSAGLSRNNLNVGWIKAVCPELAAGQHQVEITALNTSRQSGIDKIDIALMGEQAVLDVGAAKEAGHLLYLQLDAWMLADSK